MNEPSICDFCIYTIAHTSKLNEIFEKKNGKGSLTERKKWVMAQRLLSGAKRNQEQMYVVFASAEECDDLIYWAKLEDVNIEADGNDRSTTIYCFSNLTPFPSPFPKKISLILRSGNSISNGFIRPYAICRTPKSLLGKNK
ncbi:MAG: hypothetical protein AB7U82_28340 [Blastocatellales bacterium]